MKKIHLSAIIAALVLSACSAPHPASGVSGDRSGYTLAQQHWSDVTKIRAEARRIGAKVRDGQMTKVQAAQHLNRFRLRTSGSNIVDDSVYEVYLRSAVDNQRGNITAQQQRAYVENALKGWQQRWSSMHEKPNNPAFTNFLLEFMGMKPLQ